MRSEHYFLFLVFYWLPLEYPIRPSLNEAAPVALLEPQRFIRPNGGYYYESNVRLNAIYTPAPVEGPHSLHTEDKENTLRRHMTCLD